jgi:hypothetical protein
VKQPAVCKHPLRAAGVVAQNIVAGASRSGERRRPLQELRLWREYGTEPRMSEDVMHC